MQGDKRMGAEKDFENKVKDFLKKKEFISVKTLDVG
jgi:hypothetical protein